MFERRMCHLWLQVLPVNFDAAQGDPRMLLQEALARHNMEKDPTDFEAHYDLAAMLQAKKLDAPCASIEAALRLRPDDAVANNAMGAVLLAAGNPECGRLSGAALKTRPDYFDARYNLGTFWPRKMILRVPSDNFGWPCKRSPTTLMQRRIWEARSRKWGVLRSQVSF